MDLVAHIRKCASLENGKRFLEEKFSPSNFDSMVVTRLQKAAEADVGLLKIAAWLDAGDSLEVYEALGGTLKKAEPDPMARAKGSSRVDELLSSSRVTGLEGKTKGLEKQLHDTRMQADKLRSNAARSGSFTGSKIHHDKADELDLKADHLTRQLKQVDEERDLEVADTHMAKALARAGAAKGSSDRHLFDEAKKEYRVGWKERHLRA